MSRERTTLCYGIAVATGVLAWVGPLLIAGIAGGELGRTIRREAWDLDLWWTTGLPLGWLVAGVLGWLRPVRIWRWPLTIIGTQFVCALVLSRSGLSLLPFALVFMLVLTLPGLLAAWLGRSLRRFCRIGAEGR